MSALYICQLWWALFGVLLGFSTFWIYDRWFRRDGETALALCQQELAELKLQRLYDGDSSALQQGFHPLQNGEDNLTIIEGIGPKIAVLLCKNGVGSFAALADISVARLQGILDEAGPAYKMAQPETWPKQAKMCVEKQWSELRLFQESRFGVAEPVQR